MATKKPIARPTAKITLPGKTRAPVPTKASPVTPAPSPGARPKPKPPRSSVASATTPTPRPTGRRAALPASRPAAAIATAGPEALVDTVIRLKRDIDNTFYELGLALAALERPEAYRALGYNSFEELLVQRKLVSRPTAFKLTSIVSAYDARTAGELGIDKAYAVIRYTRVEHPSRTAPDVLALDPFVRHKNERVRLSQMSARALDEAVSAMQAAQKPHPAISDKRLEKASRSLSQLLRHAGVRAERVQKKARRGKPPIIRIELTVQEAEDLIALVKARRK